MPLSALLILLLLVGSQGSADVRENQPQSAGSLQSDAASHEQAATQEEEEPDETGAASQDAAQDEVSAANQAEGETRQQGEKPPAQEEPSVQGATSEQEQEEPSSGSESEDEALETSQAGETRQEGEAPPAQEEPSVQGATSEQEEEQPSSDSESEDEAVETSQAGETRQEGEEPPAKEEPSGQEATSEEDSVEANQAGSETSQEGEGSASGEEPTDEERPTLRAGVLSGELTLDGILSEAVWAAAESIENLTTVEPEEGGTPAGRTTVRVLANAREIVFGVECQDAEPSGIVSFSKARDSDLEREDHVVLVVDTFQDGRSGYVFAVNPNGARFDGLVVLQGEDVNSNWDAVWEARTARSEQGWSAEVRIPVKSIAFKKGLTSWGLNVQRRVERLQELSRWSGANRDYEIYQTSHAGLLAELPGMDLGLGLSIRPAGVLDFNRPGPGEDRVYDATPSLDVTKTLGSNALASLTVNTDFAETEADARQTNLTRFDLFFPEKRTFFLQGADIFDFGLGLASATADPGARADLIPFFSRRIGLIEQDGDFAQIPIDAGGKINGRVGETNVGALVVRTRKEDEFQVPATTMGVLRLKQNVLKESSVGMIATFGDPLGRSGSSLAGVDFTYQTSELRGDKNFLVGVWGLRNDRDDLEGDKYAYGGKIDFPNDLWDTSLSYIRIGDAFDPSLGFVPRKGKILDMGAEYRPRPGGEVVRQLKFGAEYYLVLDQKGRWESYLVTGKPLDVLFESGDSFEINVGPQGERLVEPFEIEEGVEIPPGSYEWGRYDLTGTLAEKRRVSGEFTWSFGGFYEGNLDTVEAKVLLKPSASFIAELGLERNSVDLPEGSFTQELYSGRLQINISSDLQISSLLQYDNQSRSFGTNTRLRWTFHPLGDLFVVYNHNLQRSVTDRWLFDSNQLLVKLQYALRL